MRRESTGVGFGWAASPNVSVEVAFEIHWAAVSSSRIRADVIVALIIFVSVSLWALRLRDDVLASVLALQQGLEVIVITLATSVIEDFASTSDSVVPIAANRLFAIAKTQWL